jgi:acyl dehydratase
MMAPGATAQLTRSFSVDDITLLHQLAGGDSPPPPAIPEPLIAAMISCLLGMHLPGPGANYLKQDLRFAAPAPPDTPLTATVTVTRTRPDKHLVDLATTVTLSDGTLICDGRALVLHRPPPG